MRTTNQFKRTLGRKRTWLAGVWKLRCLAVVVLLAGVSSVSALASAGSKADLSITNTTVPRPALVGRALTYGMNVINNGPDRATGVRVTDTLPPGVTLVSATFNFIEQPSQPCTGTTTIICDIGEMGVGRLEGAAVFIRVMPKAAGTLSNTATVTANEASDRSATVEVPVEPNIPDPTLEDPNLSVRTVVSDLMQPTGIAFLDEDDFLVLEKSTGQVKRVANGVVQSTVLDLAVNNFSERGLLGIALHPDFKDNGFVYLYWTCRAESPDDECAGGTEDTSVPEQVALLGNRVDRFRWDGSTLSFDQNIIQLRAFQADEGQPMRGNHDGGKILFGPEDGKLYIHIGDVGRRGWMQNVTEGFGPDGMDDQFGGPEPDNAHLTGVLLRLNDDGSTPESNPFFEVGAEMGGKVGANIQKVFAYGIRNGFGLAFDLKTGQIWESQNGDDSGNEINRIEAGFNGGWIQIMGRLERITDYKDIETSPQYFGLQQIRWSPTLIADSPEEALKSLFVLPGSRYTDPLLSWKFDVEPAGLGFVRGEGLGKEFDGDIIVGGATPLLFDGHLFRLKLDESRMDLVFSDPRLEDRVADNLDKWDITESESLLFGKGFGITTDIQTAPNGNLFVVSLTKGAVFEIFRKAE